MKPSTHPHNCKCNLCSPVKIKNKAEGLSRIEVTAGSNAKNGKGKVQCSTCHRYKVNGSRCGRRDCN